MRLHIPLLAVAAALFAFAAWRDAAVEYWLYAAPDDAPAPIRSDPRIALAMSDLAVRVPGEEDQAFWSAALETARAALRVAPLEAVAVRQIAITAGIFGQPDFVPGLLLAERLSRRDVPTQIALLRLAADADDYRQTFQRLDRVLTVNPPAADGFFGPMVVLLAEPAARTELARYGARPWFGAFASGAVDKVGRPADLATLLVASNAKPSADQPALLPRLLARLLDEGDHAVARDLALRFGKARPAALDGFALSRASTDPRFAPLTWRLEQSDAVQTGLAPSDALDVEVRPGNAVPVAERMTALAPGAYAFEQEIARGDDGDGDLQLDWALRCGADALPTWRHALSPPKQAARYRWPVNVPAECPLQRWQLTALADDAQSDASFRIAALRISRLP